MSNSKACGNQSWREDSPGNSLAEVSAGKARLAMPHEPAIQNNGRQSAAWQMALGRALLQDASHRPPDHRRRQGSLRRNPREARQCRGDRHENPPAARQPGANRHRRGRPQRPSPRPRKRDCSAAKPRKASAGVRSWPPRKSQPERCGLRELSHQEAEAGNKEIQGDIDISHQFLEIFRISIYSRIVL